MKTWISLPASLFLALGAGLSAQDQGGQDGCCPEEKQCGGSDMHALFCGHGKCDDARCREACSQAGATMKAVATRFIELVRKECGGKECGGCTQEKPCGKCAEFCRTVIVPMIRERMAARLKDPDTQFNHEIAGSDAKAPPLPCTFLKGDTCPICVEEVSDAAFRKFQERNSGKKGCRGKPAQ